MTLGEKIRRCRKELDMRQEELSKLVGVSLKTLQRWEGDERSPRVEEMNKLAGALNVSVNYLIGSEEKLYKPDILPMKENSSSFERNMEMAILTLDNGKKVEAPATPEGYAFLKEVFAMSLGGKNTQPLMA